VRQFTDTTECLQEEVMLFVNRIAHILHSIVTQCSGSANKNIGDAFLLTWKVETRYTPKQQTALADQALLCFCKALIELGRYQEFIINFSAASTARLYKRFPGYNVRIGSGLHKGWAIEGAIGSHRKIDASYLSPHVNFTEFLESSTKAYGTPLLISEPCYSMFSNTAKRYIRKVDSIRKSRNPKEPIIGLYTYDSDLSIDWADPNRKLIAKKLMPTLKAITGKFQAAARRASIGAAARLAMTPEQIAAEAEKKKEKSRLEEAEKAANDKKTKPPEIKIDRYREDVWRVDADLIDLRHRVNESFRKTFHEGIDFYIKGEWESAKAKFERCVNLSKNNGPPDGPSSFLLKFMEETNFVAPGDWEGYRIDGG
jgi:class 3 adenylate cyclase